MEPETIEISSQGSLEGFGKLGPAASAASSPSAKKMGKAIKKAKKDGGATARLRQVQDKQRQKLAAEARAHARTKQQLAAAQAALMCAKEESAAAMEACKRITALAKATYKMLRGE